EDLYKEIKLKRENCLKHEQQAETKIAEIKEALKKLESERAELEEKILNFNRYCEEKVSAFIARENRIKEREEKAQAADQALSERKKEISERLISISNEEKKAKEILESAKKKLQDATYEKTLVDQKMQEILIE